VRWTHSNASFDASTALHALNAWAARLGTGSTLGAAERLVVLIGFGEYLAQLLSRTSSR
jgi:hypothetical protein